MSESTLSRIASERESVRAAKRAAVAERRAGLLDAVNVAKVIAATGLEDRRYARAEVARFYAIGSSTSQITVKRNLEELAAAGHVADAYDEFSFRAVLLFGLLLRPGTSDNATLVHRLIDPEKDKTRLVFGPGAGKAHADAMSDLVQLVADLVGKTRMWDPGEVWKAVRELSEWEKNAALVTLLWAASEGGNRLTCIKGLDPDKREHPLGGSVTAGLATVIPTRNTAHGLTVGDACPVTDEMVGLA